MLFEMGFSRKQLLIDPGFGFGKTVQHNVLLLRNLARFKQFHVPILVGLSRKSMLAQLLQRELEQRMAGSIALAVIARENGAQLVRAHDVQETVDALTLCDAIKNAH
jgi:dihydropteroate synthase